MAWILVPSCLFSSALIDNTQRHFFKLQYNWGLLCSNSSLGELHTINLQECNLCKCAILCYSFFSYTLVIGGELDSRYHTQSFDLMETVHLLLLVVWNKDIWMKMVWLLVLEDHILMVSFIIIFPTVFLLFVFFCFNT